MANRVVNPDLRAEIKAAVDQAIASGSAISKSGLAKQFQDRGVARSTIYLWVDRYLMDAAASAVVTSPGSIPTPISQIAGEMVKSAGGGEMTIIPPGGAIPYHEDISLCLRVGRVMIRMAGPDDGSLRNVKMAATGAELLGKTLERAAKIGSSIVGREANIAFLRHMLEVVQEESPDVRDRIITKINERTSQRGIAA